MDIDRASTKARLTRAFCKQPSELVARVRLHPRGDLFRQEFEQEVGHQATRSSQAPHAAFESSRTRPI